MNMATEVFGKETFLMAFFLKTRFSMADRPGQLSYENHVETTLEEARAASIAAGETMEEHEDYLRLRSSFPGQQRHFTVDSPRRWSLDLETGDSGPSIFESYIRSSHNQVPADSSNSQGPVESSDSLMVPVESSDNQGLPESSSTDKIDDLPKCVVTAEQIANAEQCSVCMETFTQGEAINKLPCSHLFHVNCIAPWLKKRQTCPICRKTVVSAGSRPKVKLQRFQPYQRRRLTNHMLFEAPQWRF